MSIENLEKATWKAISEHVILPKETKRLLDGVVTRDDLKRVRQLEAGANKLVELCAPGAPNTTTKIDRVPFTIFRADGFDVKVEDGQVSAVSDRETVRKFLFFTQTNSEHTQFGPA